MHIKELIIYLPDEDHTVILNDVSTDSDQVLRLISFAVTRVLELDMPYQAVESEYIAELIEEIAPGALMFRVDNLDGPRFNTAQFQTLFKRCDQIAFSDSTKRKLDEVGIERVYELVSKTEAQLLKELRIGRKGLSNIKDVLSDLNLALNTKLDWESEMFSEVQQKAKLFFDRYGYLPEVCPLSEPPSEEEEDLPPEPTGEEPRRFDGDHLDDEKFRFLFQPFKEILKDDKYFWIILQKAGLTHPHQLIGRFNKDGAEWVQKIEGLGKKTQSKLNAFIMDYNLDTILMMTDRDFSQQQRRARKHFAEHGVLPE